MNAADLRRGHTAIVNGRRRPITTNARPCGHGHVMFWLDDPPDQMWVAADDEWEVEG